MNKKIGQLLKDERKKQNFTLEEISLKTKIHPSRLKAIEESDFEYLKINVFTIGFIKNYAKELKINEKQINMLCKDLIEEKTKKKEVETAPKQKKETEKPRGYPFFQSRQRLILVVSIVFAFVLTAYLFKTTNYQKPVQKKTSLKPSSSESKNRFIDWKNNDKLQSEKENESLKGISKETDKQKKIKKFNFGSNNRLKMKALQAVEIEVLWSNGSKQKIILKEQESKTLVFSSPIQLKINHGQRLILSFNKDKEQKSGNTDEPVQINFP